MRQPDGYSATELINGEEKTDKQLPDGRWVPARAEPHTAWPWTWRFKMAWDVVTGKADALYWE